MKWNHFAVVIVALVCGSWAYMTFAEESQIEFSERPRVELSELEQQISQLRDRVQHLETQLRQVAPDVRFVSVERSLLGDAPESDDETTKAWTFPGEVDEGMLFDALQRRQRIRRAAGI